MEERVVRLYEEGQLSLGGLIHAVEKGIITEEKFFIVTNKIYKNAREEVFPDIYKRGEKEDDVQT